MAVPGCRGGRAVPKGPHEVLTMGWLSYAAGFAILLGAVALLTWALSRKARGGGCGSSCCGCAFFQGPDPCDTDQPETRREQPSHETAGRHGRS